MSFSVVVARSFVVAGLLASAAVAQQPAPAASRGSVSGLVVDAATLTPLENATVALAPSSGAGAFPPARSGSPFFSAARVATTSRIGSYEFSDLAVGEYRLYIRRFGYEPATLDVELNGTTASQLSIGLTVVPVRLRAMRIQPADSARERPLVTAGVRADADSSRVRAALGRQHAYLGSDVREITGQDVVEGVSLAGIDLFRALQRLPGVSTYDDLNTQLWIRGGRSDQTRVYFDGLPLLNPLHAAGAITGVGTDAIGGAVLHPSVRPASLGGEGVAVIDLQSRAGGGGRKDDIRGTFGLSSNDISLSLDHVTKNDRAAWMLSGRRTFDDVAKLDVLTGESISPNARYSELVGRGDLDLGGGKRLEVSGLYARDYLRFAGQYQPSEGGWGNTAGRVTLRTPVGGLIASHTLGVSRFESQTPQTSLATLASDDFVGSLTAQMLLASTVSNYVTFSGDLRPRTDPRWAAGYSITSQYASSVTPRFLLAWDDLSDAFAREKAQLTYATVWADRRWQPSERLTMEAGMRLDVGGNTGNGSALRPAPSLQARYNLGASTLLSVGLGRSYQYVQELPLLTQFQGPFTPGTWLLGSRGLQARHDQTNVGIEHWTGAGFLLAANLYARRSSGVATTDPRPGVPFYRPLYISANENAHGFELSARRLTGRVTGSVAYSNGRSTRESQGLTFDAPGDRRHTLDATLLARLGSFRLGGALMVTTGLPYTRAKRGIVDGDSVSGYFWRNALVYEHPNAQRFPRYESVDVLADWTRMIRGSQVTVFAQMPNIFRRANVSRYFPGVGCSAPGPSEPGAGCVNGDYMTSARWSLGWPSLGMRIAF